MTVNNLYVTVTQLLPNATALKHTLTHTYINKLYKQLELHTNTQNYTSIIPLTGNTEVHVSWHQYFQ